MSDLTQYVPAQKHFESAYHKALLKLLPKGILWPKNQDDGSFFDCVFGALAAELSRLEGRAFNLFKEAIPGLSEEMLEDWETTLDLPEYGISTGELTIEQRQQIAQAKFYSDYNLGLSKQFYIDYAATLGFTVTIDDSGDQSKPFLVACVGVDAYDIGSRVGDRLNDSSQVANVVITITAGPDDDSVLKKIFEIIKPAHVIITWVRVKLFVQQYTTEGYPLDNLTATLSADMDNKVGSSLSAETITATLSADITFEFVQQDTTEGYPLDNLTATLSADMDNKVGSSLSAETITATLSADITFEFVQQDTTEGYPLDNLTATLSADMDNKVGSSLSAETITATLSADITLITLESAS